MGGTLSAPESLSVHFKANIRRQIDAALTKALEENGADVQAERERLEQWAEDRLLSAGPAGHQSPPEPVQPQRSGVQDPMAARSVSTKVNAVDTWRRCVGRIDRSLHCVDVLIVYRHDVG